MEKQRMHQECGIRKKLSALSKPSGGVLDEKRLVSREGLNRNMTFKNDKYLFFIDRNALLYRFTRSL